MCRARLKAEVLAAGIHCRYIMGCVTLPKHIKSSPLSLHVQLWIRVDIRIEFPALDIRNNCRDFEPQVRQSFQSSRVYTGGD
jgi:hypothetical protein